MLYQNILWWNDFENDQEWFSYCEKTLERNKDAIKEYIEKLQLFAEGKDSVNGPHKFYCVLYGGIINFISRKGDNVFPKGEDFEEMKRLGVFNYESKKEKDLKLKTKV